MTLIFASYTTFSYLRHFWLITPLYQASTISASKRRSFELCVRESANNLHFQLASLMRPSGTFSTSGVTACAVYRQHKWGAHTSDVLTTFIRSPHLQTQLQVVPILSSLCPSLISFSSFTFTGASYRIFLLFLPWIPCHFYHVFIEKQQYIALWRIVMVV